MASTANETAPISNGETQPDPVTSLPGSKDTVSREAFELLKKENAEKDARLASQAARLEAIGSRDAAYLKAAQTGISDLVNEVKQELDGRNEAAYLPMVEQWACGLHKQGAELAEREMPFAVVLATASALNKRGREALDQGRSREEAVQRAFKERDEMKEDLSKLKQQFEDMKELAIERQQNSELLSKRLAATRGDYARYDYSLPGHIGKASTEVVEPDVPRTAAAQRAAAALVETVETVAGSDQTTRLPSKSTLEMENKLVTETPALAMVSAAASKKGIAATEEPPPLSHFIRNNGVGSLNFPTRAEDVMPSMGGSSSGCEMSSSADISAHIAASFARRR